MADKKIKNKKTMAGVKINNPSFEERLKERQKIFLTRIQCRCGSIMIPSILSNIIDYHCPKVRFWNFWKHDTNVAFLRKVYKSTP